MSDQKLTALAASVTSVGLLLYAAVLIIPSPMAIGLAARHSFWFAIGYAVLICIPAIV
ncbi:hypothetical protein HC928_12865 [bacterium]|nr:hypothetical protein [bacterium]